MGFCERTWPAVDLFFFFFFLFFPSFSAGSARANERAMGRWREGEAGSENIILVHVTSCSSRNIHLEPCTSVSFMTGRLKKSGLI